MFDSVLKIRHEILVLAAFDVCLDYIYRAFNARAAGVDQQIIFIAAAPFIVGIKLVISAALLVDLPYLPFDCRNLRKARREIC